MKPISIERLINSPAADPNWRARPWNRFIGVPVQYYGVIDFGAFIKFIDEIGGVEVKPNEPVTHRKPSSAGMNRCWKPAKIYQLDGGLALAYARERHTAGGDVDHARATQVILAIRQTNS